MTYNETEVLRSTTVVVFKVFFYKTYQHEIYFWRSQREELKYENGS
jgi:hypothetical protein